MFVGKRSTLGKEGLADSKKPRLETPAPLGEQ